MKKQGTFLTLVALGVVLAVATATPAAITAPTDLGGLRLWLDADDTSTLWQDFGATMPANSNGNEVRLWQDKSGNANHVVTIDDTDRPHYNTSTGFTGTSAGAALWFDDDNIQRAGSIGILGDQDMTMISVWVDAANTGTHYQHTVHYGSTDGGNRAYGQAVMRTEDNMIANHYWGGGFSTTASGLGGPTTAISTWDADGGAGSNGLDSWFVREQPAGTHEVDLDIGGNNAANTTLTIGSRLAPSEEGIRGNLAEVIIYDRVLTQGEIDDVGEYARLKWGVAADPTPPPPPPAIITVEVYDGTNNTMASADAARGSNVTGAPTNPGDNPGPDMIGLANLGTNGDGAFPGQAGVPAPGGGDSYAVFLTGYLKVDNTANPGGMWTFGTFSDDNSRIRIDLDQDGIFEGSLTGEGGIAGETVAYQGGCCGAVLGASFAMPDGVYRFEAAFTEGGGGDYGEFFYAPGNPGFNTTNYALIGDSRLGIATATDIPEPMTMLAVGLGISGLAGYIRRRKRR